MKSVNYPLRKAYTAKLDGMIVGGKAIPVFYQQQPDLDAEDLKAYVIMSAVNNTDISSQSSSDTDTSLQLTIHTWDDGGNDGKMCDDIGQKVFDLIYPTPQSVLDLSADGVQMVSIKMQSDFVTELSGHGNRYFIDRTIIFSHKIYHK